MDSQHEDRCNCKSDDSQLPTPQFLLPDPASQDPSSSSPALFPATPTGMDEVSELTREVFNQDLIMLSYFSGTRHLSHGLLNWMKLYVRLQSWNLGNEDALTPDDLAIVENPGLIPILPTLRKKPWSEREELAPHTGSMIQPLQQCNNIRAETSTAPLLLSDSNNPPVKLQCVPKTVATLATTDIAATTKASSPALIPTTTSLANAENAAQKAEGKELKSETAFTAEQKPELQTQTKRASVSARPKNLEHAPFNEKWKLTKENIDEDVDMSIHRLRAIKSITAEPNSIVEIKPVPTDKPVPESVLAQKVTPVTVSESMQKLEIALINNNNSNLPRKEDLSITEDLYKLHAQKPDTIEPFLSTKTIPESTTTSAFVLQSAKKPKLALIDSSKETNEVNQISVSEFINELHKPVTANPATNAKTKPEPSTECASVSESALKIETASIITIYKLLKKKVKKAIKRDKAPKRWHSDSVRRHHAVCSPMENNKTASEYLDRLLAQISATEAETKLEPTTECAYVSENTVQLDPTPIDTKQKHWNGEEINKTDKMSSSEFATEKPASKTKTTPELTTEGASVSDSALKIETAPIDTEEKLLKEEINNEINTQNGEVSPSAAKRQPRFCARRRKKNKISESEFINRLIAHMSATKRETNPETATKCTYISENTLHLKPTPIDTKQNHWNEKALNKIDKISTSDFISRLSAQTSTTEKPATITKTRSESTTEGAPVSEITFKIDPVPINTEEKLSKEEMNNAINTQNGEASPSAAKRTRKKDKISESEFINRLLAHMSATKPETNPEPATKCVNVSENTLHLEPTPIDTQQRHWNEEEINKTDKVSASEFIKRLSAQTSATDETATKTKTTPEFTTVGAPVSESALKIEPSPIEEGKISKAEMNNVINTQNSEASPSAAKRRRKKEKISESELMNKLIAHIMSVRKPETNPEPATKCAYVSENTLHLDPMPIDTKHKHSNEEEINKIHKISASDFIYNAQTSAIEKPAGKTKPTPEFTTECASISVSALKIKPALIDTEGKLSKEEMNKVTNTQNGEAPPSASKRRARVSARRRKKDNIPKSEFICRLNAHIMSQAATKPEPTAENNAVLQNTQILQATLPNDNTNLMKKEAINETVVMSMPGSCNVIRANMPAATEMKLEPEIQRAPVLEGMQILEPSSVKRKRPKKRKRSKKESSTQETRAVTAASLSPSSPSPASPSPVYDAYTTRFKKLRVMYYDYFNFLENEFDKITQTDNDC